MTITYDNAIIIKIRGGNVLYHAKEMKRDLAIVGGLGLVYSSAILIKHPIGCLIERTIGIPCPTCGMSSALFHACHLDFATAFYFHPLFFTVPIAACYYAYETYFRKTRSKYFEWIMGSGIVLFFIVYLIRMIWFRESIV